MAEPAVVSASAHRFAFLLSQALLISGLAFPLPAQEQTESPAGRVQQKALPNGCVCYLQPAPELPVVAVTLAHEWGRAQDPPGQPGTVEFLNRLLNRSTRESPSGSILLRAEEIGARLSWSAGERWSEYTLVVPRAHTEWALQVQLQRLEGPWLKGSDWQSLPGLPSGLDLASFCQQQWSGRRSVLAVVGGYEPASVQRALSAPRASGGATPATELSSTAGPLTYRPGRLAWKLPLPASPAGLAAARIWQAHLQDQDLGVELDLDPVEEAAWLSTPCASPDRLEAARSMLRQTVQEAALPPSPQARARALLRYLHSWDELASRARQLALRPRFPANQVLEHLRKYDSRNWKTDMGWAALPQAQEAVYRPVSAEAVSNWPTRPQRGHWNPPARFSPGAAVPFTRLEFSPHCSALVQTVTGSPLLAVKAVVPGGAALDAPSQAGRAEWLGAVWQESLDGEYPTDVETGTHHWTFSATLPPGELENWLRGFLTTLSTSRLDDELLRRGQRRLLRQRPGPLQAAYQRWLKQLYPPEHPLGRQGELAQAMERLTAARVQELAERVVAAGHWNLFLSGEVTPARLQSALQLAGGAREGAEALASSPLPPPAAPSSDPVVLTAPVKRATLLLGGHGPARKDADYYAFVLLLQLLAGDPVRSRLQLELRHKAPLAERVDCSFLSSTTSAPWLLRVDCQPEQLPAVQACIRQQLQNVSSSEVSADELQRAIGRLEGTQQLAAGDCLGRVAQLRNLELFRLADNYNEAFAGIYRAVSAKDVLRAAQLRLQQPLATVLLLPEKSSP